MYYIEFHGVYELYLIEFQINFHTKYDHTNLGKIYGLYNTLMILFT